MKMEEKAFWGGGLGEEPGRGKSLVDLSRKSVWVRSRVQVMRISGEPRCQGV